MDFPLTSKAPTPPSDGVASKVANTLLKNKFNGVLTILTGLYSRGLYLINWSVTSSSKLKALCLPLRATTTFETCVFVTISFFFFERAKSRFGNLGSIWSRRNYTWWKRMLDQLFQYRIWAWLKWPQHVGTWNWNTYGEWKKIRFYNKSHPTRWFTMKSTYLSYERNAPKHHSL